MTLRTLAPVGEAHDSRCYAPLRIRGITSSVLTLFSVETVVDDAAGAIYWRVPVERAAGETVTTLLVPIADPGEPAPLLWEGPLRPDLLYGERMLQRGEPLVIVPGLSHVWLLASLDIRACAFLCSPRAAPPQNAIAAIVAGLPACCVVLDDGTAHLPAGAHAVTRALRRAGCPAGAFALPDLFHGAFPTTVSDWVQFVGRDHDALMAGLCDLDPVSCGAEQGTTPALQRVRAA